MDPLTGFLLLALAGALQALFALPMKYFRGWRWEQVWIAQSLTSNLLFPAVWAGMLPASFWTTAADLPISGVLRSYGWGIVWGIGGAAYGLTLTRLGFAFAYSFIFALTTLCGALLPILLGSAKAPQSIGAFGSGLALCVVAMFLTAAGVKGIAQRDAVVALALPFRLHSYSAALTMAAIAGLFSSGFGLAFGFEYWMIERMLLAGLPAVAASGIVAFPLYLGTATFAIPFGLICARRSQSLHLFWTRPVLRNWMLSLSMGILGVGGCFLFATVSAIPWRLQPNVAFAIFMTFFIASGNAMAAMTGEWHAAATHARLLFALGVGALILAAWLLKSS